MFLFVSEDINFNGIQKNNYGKYYFFLNIDILQYVEETKRALNIMIIIEK